MLLRSHDTPPMDFDNLFATTGGFGAFQIIVFIYASIPQLYQGIQDFGINILAVVPNHWCHVDRLSNISHEYQQYIAIPYGDNDFDDADDGELSYSNCEMVDLPWNQCTDDQLKNWSRNLTDNATTVKCSSWTYDYSEIKSSAVIEWDLVCDDLWLKDLASTLYVGGLLAGSFVVGPISDRFGRVPAIVICTFIYAVLGTATAFAPSYAVFATFRFLVPVALKGAYLAGFVLAMEVTGPSKRYTLGALSQYVYVIGGCAVAGMGYMVRDFRDVQIVMAAPAIMVVILWWLLPESPRWLLSMDKIKKAEQVLRQITVVNGREIPDDLHDNVETVAKHMHSLKNDGKTGDGKKNDSFLDLFRHTDVRNITLIIFYVWIVIYVVINAITFNVDSLSGDLYINILVGSVVEIPAHLLCILGMRSLGRKPTLVISFIVTTAAALVAVPILKNDDMELLITGMSFIMRGGIASALSCASVYTTEVFPTPIRQVTLGTMTSVGNGFGMLAPFLGGYMATLWEPMLYVVCGILALIGAGLSILLPETRGEIMPDNLQHTRELIHHKQRLSKRKAPRFYSFSEVSVNSTEKNRDNYELQQK